MDSKLFLGTAGWSIPKESKPLFSDEGSHLKRYSQVLNAAEINSSFYKFHKASTYQKWAESTPAAFRFSLKLNQYFTHEKRLQECGASLVEVIQGSKALGAKWGALVVQLPPSLEFSKRDAQKFMTILKLNLNIPIVWEVRNKSWGSNYAIEMMEEFGMSKVLADPEPVFLARKIRTRVQSTIYLRLHGAPEIYRSSYGVTFIAKLALRLKEVKYKNKKSVWCIFDNTTFGHATKNCIDLKALVEQSSVRPT